MRAPASALPMSASGSRPISATAPIAASGRSRAATKFPSPCQWMTMTDGNRSQNPDRRRRAARCRAAPDAARPDRRAFTWSAPPMTAKARCAWPRRWSPTWCCSTSPCPAWTGSKSPARLSRQRQVAGRRVRHRVRPVRGRRLRRCGDRLSDEAGRRRAAEPVDRTRPGLSRGSGRARAGRGAGRRRSPWLEEFWASDLSGLVRIASRDIDRVTAERDYMRLHVAKRSWLIHHSMAALEEGPRSGAVRPPPPLGDRPARFHRRLQPQCLRPLDRAAGRRQRTAGRPPLRRPGPGHRRPLTSRL